MTLSIVFDRVLRLNDGATTEVKGRYALDMWRVLEAQGEFRLNDFLYDSFDCGQAWVIGGNDATGSTACHESDARRDPRWGWVPYVIPIPCGRVRMMMRDAMGNVWSMHYVNDNFSFRHLDREVSEDEKKAMACPTHTADCFFPPLRNPVESEVVVGEVFTVVDGKVTMAARLQSGHWLTLGWMHAGIVEHWQFLVVLARVSIFNVNVKDHVLVVEYAKRCWEKIREEERQMVCACYDSMADQGMWSMVEGSCTGQEHGDGQNRYMARIRCRRGCTTVLGWVPVVCPMTYDHGGDIIMRFRDPLGVPFHLTYSDGLLRDFRYLPENDLAAQGDMGGPSDVAMSQSPRKMKKCTSGPPRGQTPAGRRKVNPKAVPTTGNTAGARTQVPRRRRRPGMTTLSEIRKLQRFTDLCLAFRSFLRLMREVVEEDIAPGMGVRFLMMAVRALMEAAEVYLVANFENTNEVAIHSKRVTIQREEDERQTVRIMSMSVAQVEAALAEVMEYAKEGVHYNGDSELSLLQDRVSSEEMCEEGDMDMTMQQKGGTYTPTNLGKLLGTVARNGGMLVDGSKDELKSGAAEILVLSRMKDITQTPSENFQDVSVIVVDCVEYIMLDQLLDFMKKSVDDRNVIHEALHEVTKFALQSQDLIEFVPARTEDNIISGRPLWGELLSAALERLGLASCDVERQRERAEGWKTATREELVCFNIFNAFTMEKELCDRGFEEADLPSCCAEYTDRAEEEDEEEDEGASSSDVEVSGSDVSSDEEDEEHDVYYDLKAAGGQVIKGSDFTKTAMPRGGKGTRPPQRPLGASGGYERHGPCQRESNPVYNDGDMELFLDSFWEHARRMGWTVTQAIEKLRGAGRFEEPIARIRREATTRQEVEIRMEELRPSPVGPDGRPIRLEIGNASDFIPSFEWFMQEQGIQRDDWMQTLPLWTRKAERPLTMQIRDMARDWESCRAHLREAFRRPELPQPRVERRQRSQRPRDPEPREARPSRGGRKTLARREQEPEDEERGAYPECGLGPVEFHRFTEGGLRRSPAHTQGKPPASEGPLRELKMHLDISRWRASLQGEEHGEQAEEVSREEVSREEVPQGEIPREEMSREEVPQEEVQGTQRERGLGDEGRHAGKEVIEVGEDTPPQTPAVGLRLGGAPGSTRQAKEGLQREETPLPSSEKAPSPEERAERRRERATVRREALILIDRHLSAHALEHPDLEEPAPAEPRQESCQPEKEMEAEIPRRVDLRTKERVPAGETAEKKRARRTRRIDEIWQKRQRLEAAGELPEQQQERQRSEAAGALPGQPPSVPAKAPEIPEMWRDFWEQRGEELPSPVRAGFGVVRKAKERLDRKIKFLAKTTFDRHLLLEGDLAGKKMKEASHGVRLEAMEVEIQELRALVASQAAIIESLRQQTQGKVDRPESSRQGEQRQPGHGLPGQPSATEPRQESPMGRVILEPEEARAQRQAEREAFEFRAPTELATLPVAAVGLVVRLAVEEGLPPSSSEPTQGSAERSMGVLLEAVHTMQEEVSLFSPEQRIEEPLEREMGIEEEGAIEGRLQRIGTPEYGPEEIEEQHTVVPGAALERRPQRLDTPEYVPATEDLRGRLGFWATGSGSGGPVPGTERQEVVGTAAPQTEQQGVVSTLAGSPSSPPSQPGKKKFKRKVDQLCFYCKRSGHHALDCLEFLEDKAAGKISEVGGKMYDRQGRIVEKSADGLRAQLYRQNQEELRR
ncbi:hypothetical protein CBR_g17622 [Chara braunii]|uniref:CCHC-type domain-containing protein n=1 Tax=Chara braunii TaxID=69332 RepID=A0A388KV37_CHABU|nr:hypothetical protein CBR_g17622 [Chara braunii]|eukprot:GBG73907.1 hypothetical protein CBR_g17622 [Chara braunii]